MNDEQMEKDRQYELINDNIDNEAMSVCCSGKMIGDICMTCKEHSSAVEEED